MLSFTSNHHTIHQLHLIVWSLLLEMMWDVFTFPVFCDAGEGEKTKYKQQHQQKQDEASLESGQLFPFLWGDKQQKRADTPNSKSSVSTFATLYDAFYRRLLKTIQLCLFPP